MIFVTIGTTKFPFDRLLKAVDEAMINSRAEEKLVILKGNSSFLFNYQNVKIFKELPFNKVVSYIKKSRVVITHGGPATIFLVLKFGKNKPLVVPRGKKFSEHVDDHQVFFTKFLNNRGLISCVLLQEELVGKIKDYILQPQSLIKKKNGSAREKLIKKLIAYTEQLKE